MGTLSLIIFLLTVELCFAQSIDFDLIKYNGLNFYSTKSEIEKKLGKPTKVYDSNHECGFLLTDFPDSKYLTLDYGKLKFTGNKKELYVIEQIHLENDNSIIIKYGNRNLTCGTDLKELIEIFGNKLAKHFGKKLKGTIVLFCKKTDDGIRISIKDGKLTQLEYWSPC
ncbi:hypothetical protein [Tenacibaculum sp. MAR_2009_124]|uniref:hypothetical protein n=1 Tax=Tenacibaculum sp. MAR_2009_124 TaxID=1250059 RepID=UPI000B86662B|nr:hypothetical protein [Tenacibaculum sp. MAR_2009_124]